MRVSCALVTLAAAIACTGDPAGPAAPAAIAFTLSTAGTETVTMSGHVLRPGLIPDGFSETKLSQSSVVDPILLVDGFPAYDPGVDILVLQSNPQLSIGVLGVARVRSYTVHRFGTRLGERPEVYGMLILKRADGGTRRFELSDGTFTIEAVTPVLRGVFSFRSTSYTDWPAQLQPGTSATSQPGNLTITGSFGLQR